MSVNRTQSKMPNSQHEHSVTRPFPHEIGRIHPSSSSFESCPRFQPLDSMALEPLRLSASINQLRLETKHSHIPLSASGLGFPQMAHTLAKATFSNVHWLQAHFDAIAGAAAAELTAAAAGRSL